MKTRQKHYNELVNSLKPVRLLFQSYRKKKKQRYFKESNFSVLEDTILITSKPKYRLIEEQDKAMNPSSAAPTQNKTMDDATTENRTMNDASIGETSIDEEIQQTVNNAVDRSEEKMKKEDERKQIAENYSPMLTPFLDAKRSSLLPSSTATKMRDYLRKMKQNENEKEKKGAPKEKKLKTDEAVAWFERPIQGLGSVTNGIAWHNSEENHDMELAKNKAKYIKHEIDNNEPKWKGGNRENKYDKRQFIYDRMQLNKLTKHDVKTVLLHYEDSRADIRKDRGYPISPTYADDSDDESVPKNTAKQVMLRSLCEDVGGYNFKGQLLRRRIDFQKPNPFHFVTINTDTMTEQLIKYICERPTGLSCFSTANPGTKDKSHIQCRCFSDIKQQLGHWCSGCYVPDRTGVDVYVPGKLSNEIKKVFEPVVRLFDALINRNQNNEMWNMDDILRYFQGCGLIPFRRTKHTKNASSVNLLLIMSPALLLEHPELEYLIGKIVLCYGSLKEICGRTQNAHMTHRFDKFYSQISGRRVGKLDLGEHGDWHKYLHNQPKTEFPGRTKMEKNMSKIMFHHKWYPTTMRQLILHAQIAIMVERDHSKSGEAPSMRDTKDRFTQDFWGYAPPSLCTPEQLFAVKDHDRNYLQDNMSDAMFKSRHDAVQMVLGMDHNMFVLADARLSYSHMANNHTDLSIHYRSRKVLPPPNPETNTDQETCAEIREIPSAPIIQEPRNLREFLELQKLELDEHDDSGKDEEGREYAETLERRFYNCVIHLKDSIAYRDQTGAMVIRHSSDFGVCSFEDKSVLLKIGKAVQLKSYTSKSTFSDGDSHNRMIGLNNVPMDISLLMSNLGISSTEFVDPFQAKCNYLCNNLLHETDATNDAWAVKSIIGVYSIYKPNLKGKTVELPHLPWHPTTITEWQNDKNLRVFDVVIPCSERGACLKGWSKIDQKNNTKEQWNGQIIHIGFGSMAIFPSTFIRAEGYYTSYDGCPTLHLSVVMGKYNTTCCTLPARNPVYVLPNADKSLATYTDIPAEERNLSFVPFVSEKDPWGKNQLIDGVSATLEALVFA